MGTPVDIIADGIKDVGERAAFGVQTIRERRALVVEVRVRGAQGGGAAGWVEA